MVEYFESFSDWYFRIGGDSVGIEQIEEAFSLDAVPEKRSKRVELFVGRTNPPHSGHLKIIKSMKNPIVALVKGSKSSKDKDRNPLDANYQTYLLRKMIPGLRVIIVNNGYLPEIISSLREATHNEVVKVYAGDDRLGGYKNQIDRTNKHLDSSKQFDIDFVVTKRYTSASKVREAIRSNNEDEFKKLMPKAVWDDFEELKRRMTK